ncbi:MAG: hypothetical protein ACREQO_03725 [Candidatus Binatia bacterium]
MIIARSRWERIGKTKVAAAEFALVMVMLIILLAGCSSIIRNSEGFYEKIPRRPINWREYMTD